MGEELQLLWSLLAWAGGELSQQLPGVCSCPGVSAAPVGTTKPPHSPSQYSLIKDVVSSLKRHRMHEQQFTHHPLLVLNNFGLPQIHVKLMATMLQNMFPSINVHKVSAGAKGCGAWPGEAWGPHFCGLQLALPLGQPQHH